MLCHKSHVPKRKIFDSLRKVASWNIDLNIVDYLSLGSTGTNY